jgi:sulfur carrier protein ThiS
MPGQLALVLVEEQVVPAAVWETLPLEARAKVTIMLARLLAAMVEEARDE